MTNETNQFGAWQAWQPPVVARFFSALTVPWWIAGGWALDLFLGEQTREHEDIDIEILRRDQQEVRSLFRSRALPVNRSAENSLLLRGFFDTIEIIQQVLIVTNTITSHAINTWI